MEIHFASLSEPIVILIFLEPNIVHQIKSFYLEKLIEGQFFVSSPGFCQGWKGYFVGLLTYWWGCSSVISNFGGDDEHPLDVRPCSPCLRH